MMFRRSLCIFLLLAILFSLSACGEAPKQPQGTSVVTIAAVGDITITDMMLKDAEQSDDSYDFMPLFSGAVNVLSAADLTIGNLEGTFNGEPYGMNSYPDALASALSGVGFDLLQTANSFSIQNGLSGLQRTKSVIESESMTAVGTYISAQDREDHQVIVREVNGIRIAFVAFTKGLNSMSVPSGAEYCVNLLYTDYSSNYSKIDTDGILGVIAAAKAQQPDVIIAALHWGSENVTEISSTQEKIADLLFENGVDAIIGSHSHLVGTIEQRTVTTQDGTKKDVVLAYSLGDFCTTGDSAISASIVLNLEFTRDHTTGTTALTGVAYTPVATVDNGASAAHRFSVLEVEKEIALYEENYFDRISQDLYELLLPVPDELALQITPDTPD